MPARFTIPPDTRAVGTVDPPGDMNKIVDALSAWGYPYNILNTTWNGTGAFTDGTTDSTAAIQACMNAAAAAGFPVFIPAGLIFRATQLTWNAGQVLQGVYSGTFPGNTGITTASQITRLASSNLDLITIPDGTNYGAIRDLNLDGNKNNNTSGYGVLIADGAAGQECQILIERCYIHDNPFSNIYLGKNRRGCKILNSILNFSGAGDGITVAGSDNMIQRNIVGSNFRAGICLGTTITQNWAASSPSNSATVTHVSDNDIYQNQVGIAVAASSWGNMVAFNGIDRNTKQGITVYSDASNSLVGNSFHSNGTLTNNTYGHIDVASGVVQVAIADNDFGPLDGGVSNVASYGVVVAAGAPAGCVTGNVGVVDATSTVSGLISSTAKLLSPAPVVNPAPQLYGYLGWTYDTAMSNGGTVLGTAGTITLCKIPWPVTQSVTNIVVRVTAGGTLTASQCFAGIYDSSGNRLGVTADQSGVWNGAGTAPKTMAISGGPVTVPGGGLSGFIYVALLWNGSVSPSFLKAVNADAPSFNGALGAAALRGALNSSANTSLPTPLTLSSSTAGGSLFWAAVS